MEFVKSFKFPNIKVGLWYNSSLSFEDLYDLSLIDGILPRDTQFNIGMRHSRIIALDDFAGRIKSSFMPKLKEFERLDSGTTLMAIFKIIQNLDKLGGQATRRHSIKVQRIHKNGR